MAGTTSGVKISKNQCDTDIILYQGKTVNFSVIWGGDTPIDVTGYSARLQARETADAATALVDLSNGSGITVGTTDGLFTISMSATDSAAVAAFVGVYDFEIEDSSGNVYLVMSGKFTCLAEVTK